MSLLEQEAIRIAAALDDYELVSVSDIGKTDKSGSWLTVRDNRFGLETTSDRRGLLGLPRLLLCRRAVADEAIRFGGGGVMFRQVRMRVRVRRRDEHQA